MRLKLCLLALSLPLIESAKKTLHHSNGAFAAGQNVGAGVNNLIGAKFSAIGGFLAGLVTGQSANTGHHPSGGGCGSHGCGGGSSYSSGCGSHGCGGGSSYSSGCGSHGCGGGSSYSSGSSSCHNCGSVSNTYHPAPSYNSYPNCQCDWLFNDHGQGNCNVGASSHTSDRWCYVKTKVNGKWIDPQWACPDSKASSVHHGRYWSNTACNTQAPRG
eukprot:TRINITY_DN4684_c0_g1_i5.p1 TRINITY_DN4684_c0_g1~~TRINITY_DN4684_c0_g1_i5.p1  ORF type:complete len:215 (-),score=27.09 TRINITY_DN4684_c0_g1_i5:609-1253(-)